MQIAGAQLSKPLQTDQSLLPNISISDSTRLLLGASVLRSAAFEFHTIGDLSKVFGGGLRAELLT